jgi:hypothetical protein
MQRVTHLTTALLIGLSLGLSAGPASAQELPTGAARIVEKVQTRIFISKSTLLLKVSSRSRPAAPQPEAPSFFAG